MTDRREDLRAALGRVRGSPSLLAAGSAVVWTWVGVILLVGAATDPIETVAGGLLVAAGEGRTGFLGPSVPRASLLLVRTAIELALLVVLLEVAWVLVALPVDATAAALLRDEADGWTGAIRRTAGVLPRLLGAALLYRGIAGLLFPVAVGLAVAAYLTLGTLLEALGYAVGLYAFVPWYVGPTAVVVALFLGRRGAASAPGRPDLAAVTDRDRPVRTVVRATVVRALSRPRRTLADGAVETALLSVPVVVGVAGVLAIAWVNPESETLQLVGLVGLLVAFVATGAAGHATAIAFRTRRVERSRGDRATAATGERDPPEGRDDPGWDHLRRSVPVLKATGLVALVVAAALVGASVRYVDATPGSREAAPPGAVTTSDDPDRIVREGSRALAGSSHALVRRSEARRIYDNGTIGEWNDGIELRLAHDRDDEQVQVVALLGDSASYMAYVDQSTYAQAHFDGNDATDEAAVRDAEWLVYPRIPGIVFDRRGGSFRDGGVYESPSGADWEVDGETDGELVLVSNDPETASAYATNSFSAESLSNVSVRLAVDAETGRLRRVEVAFDQHVEGEPFDFRRRTTIRVDGYGSTEVERPSGVERGVAAELLDVLIY